MSAKQKFDQAVAAKMQSGIKDRAQAIRAVVHANPDLHQRMLAEVNGRPMPKPATGTSAVRAFNAAVDAKVQAGIKDRGQAIRAVVHEDPALHQRMLAEVNAGRRARLRHSAA